MVFWGVEVKPGQQFTPSGNEDGEYEGSRLHLSQATLGLDGKGKERTVVKCKVGNGPELLLCSLTPGVSESCSLDLLFNQDVVFSVAGSTSVHLVGYYLPPDDEEEDDDYELEGSEFDSDEDMDDEDDEKNSDMDDMEALDAPPSSVTLTELDEDGNPATSEETPVKNRQTTSLSDEGDQKSSKKRKKAAAVKEKKKEASKELDKVTVEDMSEDEDGFPQSSEKTEAVNGYRFSPDVPPARSEELSTPGTASNEAKKQKKKKNKKEKVTSQVEGEEKAPNKAEKTPNKAEETPHKTDKTPRKGDEEKSSEGKALTKTPATNGSTASPGIEASAKKVKKVGSVSRKFPNGLEIEEIAMGKPDARQTKPGKKVTVHYTGKLKSNGKIFDSSVGKKPFVFRLGVGEVVKGWDVGVAGMRIGDKRRITIPPAMGYGAKGTGPIPGNSWLVFDVDLIDVAK